MSCYVQKCKNMFYLCFNYELIVIMSNCALVSKGVLEIPLALKHFDEIRTISSLFKGPKFWSICGSTKQS